MSSTSSGKRGRSARSARWTMPSSSQAPLPSSSFASGMPKRMHRAHAEADELVGLAHEIVHGEARHGRQRLVRRGLGRHEEPA